MKTKQKTKNVDDLALTRAMLRQATNSRYFGRGEEYFEADLVKSVKQKDDKIYATVHGSNPYQTTLWVNDGAAEGTCTCPLGRDGEFCKHLVATGLMWIESKTANGNTVRPKRIEPDDIQVWLGQQSAEALIETIMAQAMTDDEFYNVLKFRVAAEQPAENTAEMRAVLRQAMTIDNFVSWRETSAYSSGVHRVLNRLKDLLDDHADEVIELVEYTMELWEEAIQRIDDSDGCMGVILDDLHNLHLDACREAKPDSIELASRLFYRSINSGWDMFENAVETYGDVLEKKGKAHYLELVEAEWRKLPRFGPGDKNEERYGRSSKLERMMLSCAEESRDLDRIIEIMSRDLSEPYDYLSIAERCRLAKNHDLARQWAEQGIRDFPPNHHNTRLRDFLADEYVHDKRHEEAVRVIWETFAEGSCLERYQQLKKYASKAKVWPEWREKVLTHVRQNITQRKKGFTGRPRSHWEHAPDHSLLVEIFLWEIDGEAAWTEAQKGGCSESLWLQLAKAREAEHPEDAVPIYRRQVEPELNRKNNQSYQVAVDYLEKVHALMIDLGKESEFKQDLLAIKTESKRLRNFIKYVEQKQWGKGL